MQFTTPRLKIAPDGANGLGIKMSLFTQTAFIELRLGPFANRPPQPIADRRTETGLVPDNQLLRQITTQEFSRQDLEQPAPHLHTNRQRPCRDVQARQ